MHNNFATFPLTIANPVPPQDKPPLPHWRDAARGRGGVLLRDEAGLQRGGRAHAALLLHARPGTLFSAVVSSAVSIPQN